MTWLIEGILAALFTVALYLFFYSLYWASCIVIGATYKLPKLTATSNQTFNDIVVLLPAYKPNALFLEALSALKRAIENRPYIKPVILLQEATAEMSHHIKSYGYETIEKRFSHLKGNPYHHALKFLMAHLETQKASGQLNPSHVVILDKDNLVAEDFFRQLESGLKAGYDLVQGRRVPLAKQTTWQMFDAISESLNDIMFRAAKTKLRLTLEISGSGFGLKYEIMQKAVQSLDGLAPGMDKNLMVGILQHPVKSLYHPELKVYEEKTASENAIRKQRTRWLGVQYDIAWRYGVKLIWMGIKSMRLSPIDYAISLWRPPRSLQLFLIPILSIIELVMYLTIGQLPYTAPLMLIAFGMLVLGFVVFMNQMGLWSHVQQLFLKLPRFALGNLRAAIEGKKSKHRGTFIHTDHQTVKTHEQ